MKFSVVIPTYKSCFLHECLESVLSQSLQDFEVVVVDDASPNNVREVVSLFPDSRIRYYRNNVGFGAERVIGNWNKCLEYVKGEYLICMGDDDKLLPNCLQDYADTIEKHLDIDLFHIRTEIIDEKSNHVLLQEERPLAESVYSMIWNQWQGRRQYIGDFLFKTEALRRNGGFFYTPYAWSADKLTTYIIAKERGVVNVPTIGFQYRENLSTISNNENIQIGKFEALHIEHIWHKSFLSSIDDSDLCDDDKELVSLLKENVDIYMNDRKCCMMYWDINVNPMHILYWVKQRNRYGFSVRNVLRMSYYAVCVFGKKMLRKL